MLGHIRSQCTSKLQIFTCWSLSAPIVSAVRGEDAVRSTLFGHRMTHFSATFAMASSGDTIRFGSLEFPIVPLVGMWVPPVFEPSQAFLFENLDFVADRLGILDLREEALGPAPVGGAPSIGSGTHDDFNDEAFVLHSEQTLCSNPTVSNMHTVICSLFTISHRSPGGNVPPTPQTRKIGSPTTSRPPRMHTLGGSEGCWHHPPSRPSSWE